MSSGHGSRIHPVDINIVPSTLERHGTVTTIPANELDLAIASRSYGNADSKDRELIQNYQTLEEVRWSSMRKKIPGMSSVPKRMTTSAVENFDLQTQYMKDLQQFIRQHFHKRECCSFVPAPNQKVAKIKQLKCHCGAVFMEHAGVSPYPLTGSSQMVEEFIVHKDLQRIINRRRLESPVPARFPEVKWTPDEHLRKTVTNSFGKINFINVEHVGGNKPAKYIRVAADDSVEDLFELMTRYWRIMEPQAPNLVISVVGGAKNFKLDGRMRTTFTAGLVKAAKTTSAWLISSGFNMGVMKSVGQAVQQGQSFCWDNNRMAHVLRCIGIAPWGYIRHRNSLLETEEGKGKFCAEYRTSNVILHGEPVPLNSDHTHFIFVDDGYRNRYGGVAEMRSKIEQKIQQPVEVGGLGVPVVLVVVEGGTDAIADAKSSLMHKIPVVVCSGTGRAADILAYAYSHTKSVSGGAREMSEKHINKLQEKIFEAYGSSWKVGEKDSKIKAIQDSVKFCCQNADLMTIFNMNKAEDLDMAILSVLLKAQAGGDEHQRLTQLKLALTWNRVDIAQEEIFREDVLWRQGSLDDVLTEAIVTDKVKFMELILQQGVMMKEFLTLDRMETLYAMVPKHHVIYKLLIKLTGTSELTRENVLKLLAKLLDRYDGEYQQMHVLDVDIMQDDDGNSFDTKKILFNRPYKHLLIYAVLLQRQSLATFCWEMGDEPVTSAIAATRLYSAIERHITREDSSLRDTINKYKSDFEFLATKVLDECHQRDPAKAMMIVERKSPVWNEMTCLQIAAAANDQKFLASVGCQNSISITWKQGIMSGWTKLILAMFCPPLIWLTVEMLHVGVEPLKWYQKVITFYTAPGVKFLHNSLMYLCFVVLHSYLVLVDIHPTRITPIEIVCITWIFTFMVDAIHILLVFPAPTFISKIRDLYGILHYLEWLNFFMAFIGFFVHLGGHYGVTKVMYSLNSVIFIVVLTKSYTAFANLGPKLVMIKRMFGELRLFILVLLVFLLAYGIAHQGLLYQQRTPSWKILKDVVYFPYWLLYGELNLDEIGSEQCVNESVDCRKFHWMVPIILAAYLMIGNILLLNLLIAMFSNIFQDIEKQSNEIWKFQLYFLAMEYDCKTFLAPPFSIFPHTLYAIAWLYRRVCGKEDISKQTLGRRHLEYLQLFEKEMMTNYLRRAKAKEQVKLETTIHKLEKRVDELTKLIEDEVIGDQQADPMRFMMTTDGQGFTWKRADTQETITTVHHWPAIAEVLSVKDLVTKSDIPSTYITKPMLRSSSGRFVIPQRPKVPESQEAEVKNREKEITEEKTTQKVDDTLQLETTGSNDNDLNLSDKVTLENEQDLVRIEKERKRLEKEKRREEKRKRKEERRENRRKSKERKEELRRLTETEEVSNVGNDMNHTLGDLSAAAGADAGASSGSKVKFVIGDTDVLVGSYPDDSESENRRKARPKSAPEEVQSPDTVGQKDIIRGEGQYEYARTGELKDREQRLYGNQWNIAGEDIDRPQEQKTAWSQREYMSDESEDALPVQQSRKFSSHLNEQTSSEEEEKSLREKLRRKVKKAKHKKKKRDDRIQLGESD